MRLDCARLKRLRKYAQRVASKSEQTQNARYDEITVNIGNMQISSNCCNNNNNVNANVQTNRKSSNIFDIRAAVIVACYYYCCCMERKLDCDCSAASTAACNADQQTRLERNRETVASCLRWLPLIPPPLLRCDNAAVGMLTVVVVIVIVISPTTITAY